MKVISLSDEATNIDLKSISFFTMNDPLSGITENVANAGIFTGIDGEILRISAKEPIRKLEIYSMDGTLMHSAAPNPKEYSCSKTDLQKNEYLVKIVAGENQLIQKVVKN